MEWPFIVLYFIIGAIVGSFLNVVVLRYYLRSSIKGRSFCFSCGKRLLWYELIPIFSYIFLRGHCSSCKSKISSQYILVELFTASLFAGLATKGYAGLALVIPSVVLSLLIAIFIYDVRHKIVPDGLVYAFIALSFISLFVSPETMSFSYPSYSALFAGPVLFIPFFALWFFSKGEWMGLGDGKLILGMGWFLGLAKGISAVALSFWIAFGVIVVLLFLQKIMGGRISRLRLHRKTEIPFTPFLIVGYLIGFFFEFNLTEYLF